MSKTRIIITVLVVAFAFAGFVAYEIKSSKRIETAQSVETVPWLPSDATDVSYYRSYGWTAYEFSIGEQEFRKWASKYDLSEIDETVHMERWSWITFLNESSNLSSEEFQRLQSAHLTSIDSGLIGGIGWGNGGRELVAFDRVAGRAYFQSNPR